MDSRPPRWGLCSPAGDSGLGGGSSRLSRMALAVAIANVVGELESTAAWDFHDASVCAGTGYLNVGTLWAVGVSGVGWMGWGDEERERGPSEDAAVV